MGNAQGSSGNGFNAEAEGFGPGIVPPAPGMAFAPQPVQPPAATPSERTATAAAGRNGAPPAASTSPASEPAAGLAPAAAAAAVAAAAPTPVRASPQHHTSGGSAPSNAASTATTAAASAATTQPPSPKAPQQGLRLSIPSGPLPTAAATQSAPRPAARPPKLKARGGAGLSLSLSLPAGGLPNVPAGAMTARRDGFALNLGATETAALAGADVTADGILITEQHRKEFKLARMALVASTIHPGLLVSGALVAGKRDELQLQGITTVVNAAADVVPSSFAAEPWSAYLSMYLYDSPKQELSHFFPLFVKIVHETERLGGRALVHCSQGVSRSGALGIAYVMWADDCSFDKAYHKARSQRATISPNPGFICQLLEWEQLRRLMRDTPSATLLYQVTTLRRPSVCTGPIAAWMQGDRTCTRCEVKYAVTLARTPESRELVRPSRSSLGNTDCGIVRCASTAFICVGIECADVEAKVHQCRKEIECWEVVWGRKFLVHICTVGSEPVELLEALVLGAAVDITTPMSKSPMLQRFPSKDAGELRAAIAANTVVPHLPTPRHAQPDSRGSRGSSGTASLDSATSSMGIRLRPGSGSSGGFPTPRHSVGSTPRGFNGLLDPTHSRPPVTRPAQSDATAATPVGAVMTATADTDAGASAGATGAGAGVGAGAGAGGGADDGNSFELDFGGIVPGPDVAAMATRRVQEAPQAPREELTEFEKLAQTRFVGDADSSVPPALRRGAEDETAGTVVKKPKLLQFVTMDSFEDLGVFDEDDLDAGGLFILLSHASTPGSTFLVYAWRSPDFTVPSSYTTDSAEAFAEQVAKSYCKAVLPGDDARDIVVVHEVGGEESDDFWDLYES